MILGALPQKNALGTDLAKAKSRARSVGRRDAAGDARVSERSDDQRRSVRDARPEGAGRSAGSRIRDRLSGSPMATFQPKFRAGKVAFGIWLWGARLPRPSGLPRLHARPARSRSTSVGRQAAIRRSRSSPRKRGRDGPGHAKVALPADPAGAERAQPVHPADPADTGLRRDDGPRRRGLQRRLRRRRHADLSDVAAQLDPPPPRAEPGGEAETGSAGWSGGGVLSLVGSEERLLLVAFDHPHSTVEQGTLPLRVGRGAGCRREPG